MATDFFRIIQKQAYCKRRPVGIHPTSELDMKTHKMPYLSCVVVMFSMLVANKALSAEEILGDYPLCEASAALLLPCPDKKDGECLLVGDNEEGRELFLFTIQGDKLSPNANPTIDLNLKDKQKISDIEALAAVSANEILAFASHSRKASCKLDEERHKFGKINLVKHETGIVDTLKSKPITCQHLFIQPVSDASILAVCKAIDDAETKAAAIESDLQADKIKKKEAKNLCNTVNAFNAEGAVALKTDKGSEVWIGLRAPLLAVHPVQSEKKNLAILLHLKDTSAYTFDRVAFVDLEGRGIRDLSVDGDFIWIIAGPAEDINKDTHTDNESTTFQLRRMAKSALQQSKVIDAELIHKDLPDSSEGLAVSGKTAYIVIDRDKGDDDKKCKDPARYKVLSLP